MALAEPSLDVMVEYRVGERLTVGKGLTVSEPLVSLLELILVASDQLAVCVGLDEPVTVTVRLSECLLGVIVGRALDVALALVGWLAADGLTLRLVLFELLTVSVRLYEIEVWPVTERSVGLECRVADGLEVADGLVCLLALRLAVSDRLNVVTLAEAEPLLVSELPLTDAGSVAVKLAVTDGLTDESALRLFVFVRLRVTVELAEAEVLLLAELMVKLELAAAEVLAVLDELADEPTLRLRVPERLVTLEPVVTDSRFDALLLIEPALKVALGCRVEVGLIVAEPLVSGLILMLSVFDWLIVVIELREIEALSLVRLALPDGVRVSG